MVPYMVQYILEYMAPKTVPEIIILPEELLISAEGFLQNLLYMHPAFKQLLLFPELAGTATATPLAFEKGVQLSQREPN